MWVKSYPSAAKGLIGISLRGFSRQAKLEEPTDLSQDVFDMAKQLFYWHWDKLPVRRLYVNLSELSREDIVQLSLFEDQRVKEKRRTIERVVDKIKDRFGEAALLRASSLTSAGEALDRSEKIGGHYK